MIDLSVITSRIYYSQNREDLILQAFFPDLKEGFYVDVGAYDPDYDSVTKYFYDKKWHGINIEPQPDRYQNFIKKRKRDTNLNIGVSSKASQLTLRSYKNQGLSTFSKDMKEEYERTKVQDAETSTYKDISVKVSTLKHVFDEHNVVKIHFMKVDVEGLEYEVLTGNDWSSYRPEVLCIESNHIRKDWRPLLVENNYEHVFNDGLNDYYVDAMTNRKDKFDFIKYVVVERGGGIRFEDYEKMALLREYYDKHIRLLNGAEKELARYSRREADLVHELQICESKMSSTRFVFKHFFALLRNRATSIFKDKQ